MAGFSVVKRGLDAERDGRGLPSTVPTTSGTDALGRTGIVTAVNDAAPAIASRVSVTDRPWGAKFDARVVTDGAMTVGSNVLTSAGAYAVGHVVVVQTAGPTVAQGATGANVQGVLIGWVTSVGGGTATLMTTKGGSTPANASFSVSGATVKFGTDDTAALQAAINAVSATASLLGASGAVGAVHYPENRATMIASPIVPANNVMLMMYGATIHLATTNAVSSTTSMMFKPPVNVSITNWHLRGGTFPGTGTEAGSSGSQAIMYWSNGSFGGSGTATYTDISVMDTIVTNYRSAVYDIRGGARIRESNNTFKSCSTYSGLNTINVIMGGGGSPVNSSDVFIQNNYFDDNGAECIAVGEAGTPTGIFNRAIITGNICQNTGGTFLGVPGGATAIDIEWSTVTTGQSREVIVANNIIRQDAPPGSNSSYCISCGGTSMPANAHYMQRVTVTGNVCVSKDGGINVNADDAIVSNNLIDFASTTGTTLWGIRAGAITTLAVTADTNSSTSLTNVSIAASGVAENGMHLSGSGIQGGTYLVSGAGTATWTISLPATTTAAGNALTGWLLAKRNEITGNVLHTGTLAHNAIFAGQLIDSRIADNIIAYEPGSTATGFGGAGMLVQRVGRTDVVDNRVNNAPSYGILLSSAYNSEVERNRVYNPNQSNQSSINGITASSISGLPFRIRDNYCVDDNAVHLMVRGIDVGAVNSLPMLIGNDVRGATDASPYGGMTNYLLVRGNTSDLATIPAVTTGGAAGASPYTTAAVSYPTMVSVVGGTVTTVQQNRTGSSTRNLASYGGAGANVTAYLMPNDTITVTYTVAPTVNVFPLQ